MLDAPNETKEEREQLLVTKEAISPWNVITEEQLVRRPYTAREEEAAPASDGELVLRAVGALRALEKRWGQKLTGETVGLHLALGALQAMEKRFAGGALRKRSGS